jgi:hypothetical protein
MFLFPAHQPLQRRELLTPLGPFVAKPGDDFLRHAPERRELFGECFDGRRLFEFGPHPQEEVSGFEFAPVPHLGEIRLERPVLSDHDAEVGTISGERVA